MKYNLIKLMGLYFFLFYSCKSGQNRDKSTFAMNQKYVEQFNNEVLMDSLQHRILYYGDTSAYEEMSSICSLSGHEEELYFYAMVMVENFDYAEANYDMYSILRFNSKRGQPTDSFAKYYLLRAKEKGLAHLDAEIEEVFGKGMKLPTSKEYKKR